MSTSDKSIRAEKLEPLIELGRDQGDPPGPGAMTLAAENRIFEYDDNGNLTSMNGQPLKWDFKDRLIFVENEENILRFTYDYSDRRIAKWIQSKPTNSTTLSDRLIQYINSYFEIRDFETPTKFAFNGKERVARFTRRLEPTQDTIQFLRLSQGWNFVSLTVHPQNIKAHEAFNLDSSKEKLFKLEGPDYIIVESEENAIGGVPYMVKIDKPRTVTIRGPPPSKETIRLDSGLQALAWPREQGLRPNSDLHPHEETSIKSVWSLASEKNGDPIWKVEIIPNTNLTASFPKQFPPGHVVYIDTDFSLTLEAWAENPTSLRFYHADHLGSQTVTTDSLGNLLEEVVNYPYGEIRNRFHPSGNGSEITSDYQFTGKEQDRESRLSYFGARYLLPQYGRWASVDPLFDHFPEWAPYVYVDDSPYNHIDPDGRGKRKTISGKSWDKEHIKTFLKPNKIQYKASRAGKKNQGWLRSTFDYARSRPIKISTFLTEEDIDRGTEVTKTMRNRLGTTGTQDDIGHAGGGAKLGTPAHILELVFRQLAKTNRGLYSARSERRMRRSIINDKLHVKTKTRFFYSGSGSRPIRYTVTAYTIDPNTGQSHHLITHTYNQ